MSEKSGAEDAAKHGPAHETCMAIGKRSGLPRRSLHQCGRGGMLLEIADSTALLDCWR